MKRSAITLLEVIVVISIMGLLLAVLIPAVQHAREASRAASCRNNLRQFAIALQNYEGVHKVFPAGNSVGFSPHFSCLPFLEQGGLYDNAVLHDKRVVPFYLCPTDGAPTTSQGRDGAPTNYACNTGTWYTERGFDGPFRTWNSLDKGGGPPLPASAMRRGLSNISAIAEIIRTDYSQTRMRAVWGCDPEFTRYSQIDKFAAYCRNLPDNPLEANLYCVFLNGTDWSLGNMAKTLYNHVNGPNQPSALNGGMVFSAAYSASSLHPGIVHVAYLDGHVTACQDTIDIHVWRAYGPRDRSPDP